MQFKPQPKNVRRLDRRFLSIIILITGPIRFFIKSSVDGRHDLCYSCNRR